MNKIIIFLTQIDWKKIVEDTIPLILTGISVLVFYYIKKNHDKNSKEKDARFTLFEDKKLNTISGFITQQNILTITLEKGFYMNSKSVTKDEYINFGDEAFKVFSDFYQSYFSLTFYLTQDELNPFESIYLNMSQYFKCIKETLAQNRHGILSSDQHTQLPILRDKIMTSNREHVRTIGKYHRTFLKA